jgi:hypothetical protein
MKEQAHPIPSVVDFAILVPSLRAALDGCVISPDDAKYDAARTVFSGNTGRSQGRYDPTSLFRLNQNVPPAAGEHRGEKHRVAPVPGDSSSTALGG